MAVTIFVLLKMMMNDECLKCILIGASGENKYRKTSKEEKVTDSSQLNADGIWDGC